MAKIFGDDTVVNNFINEINQKVGSEDKVLSYSITDYDIADLTKEYTYTDADGNTINYKIYIPEGFTGDNIIFYFAPSGMAKYFDSGSKPDRTYTNYYNNGSEQSKNAAIVFIRSSSNDNWTTNPITQNTTLANNFFTNVVNATGSKNTTILGVSLGCEAAVSCAVSYDFDSVVLCEPPNGTVDIANSNNFYNAISENGTDFILVTTRDSDGSESYLGTSADISRDIWKNLYDGAKTASEANSTNQNVNVYIAKNTNGKGNTDFHTKSGKIYIEEYGADYFSNS